jgi:3-isopropylmalate/(R)-2-methylmalate dehydratase large subunit
VDDWQALQSDDDAAFDREIEIDASDVAPTVTWGIVPEQAAPISGTVPDDAPGDALEYMGLKTGQSLDGLPIDQVFIGSCTNARIEDLRAAAAVMAGHRAKVPGIVSPGSMIVKRLAEAEGLDRIFIDAGLDWVASGCSMCVAMNGDVVAPGKRCASTTNRNFRGRQGPGARTHLMSPAMVAAAAVTGELTDARALLKDRPLAGVA